MNVEMTVTSLFHKHVTAFKDPNCRMIVSRGGSSSSKTISIMQLLVVYALNNPGKTISILGETVPKLKKGVIKDLKSIVMRDMWGIGNFNKTDSTYTFPNGSTLQFLSADAEENVRGIRSDVLYADEVNSIKWDIFMQMMIRTREKVIASFNPSAEFEITEEVKTRDDVTEIISTYKDNEFLEAAVVRELELQGERDENFRRVFINGEYGNLDGVIFQEGKHWRQVDELPTIYDEEVWGIDYGFSNDPTALVQCRIIGNSLYLREHIYSTGLLARDIGKLIRKYNPKNKLVIAESARPEINAELQRIYGINIKKVVKPQILESLTNMKQRDIFITKDSVNLVKEFRYYQYGTKKDKYGQNLPIDKYNHGIDAIRYLNTLKFKPRNKQPISMLKF